MSDYRQSAQIVHLIDMRRKLETPVNRIRELRKAAGISQADLAAAIGLSNASLVSKLELGDHELTYSRMRDIARVLRCKPEDLLLPEDRHDPLDAARADLIRTLDGADDHVVNAVQRVAESLTTYQAQPPDTKRRA